MSIALAHVRTVLVFSSLWLCSAGGISGCTPSLATAQWRQHELDGQLVHSPAPGPAEYSNYLRVGLAAELAGWGSESGEGAPEHARRLLLANLDLRPDDAQLWARLGQLELSLGRRNAALAACQRALHIAPEHPLARSVVASISKAAGLGAEPIVSE